MKKITLLTAVLATSVTFSQNPLQEAHNHLDPLHQGVCGNNVEMERAFAENPALRIQHEQDQANFELEYQQYLAEYDPFSRAAYTVPVVVHIVHENGLENITNDQVYEAIAGLNEDFQMLNNDLSNTIAAFSGITGNTDFEFKLATRDPSGNCHLGITRTLMPGGGSHDTGDNTDILSAIQNQHGNWAQNKYMNIIVVKSIAGSAAYTNTPGNWYPSGSMQGSIYMGHTVMGTTGTGNMSSRHILSHEVGHWFNLSHCWGPNNSAGDPGSCSTDDGVADTPNTIGWQGNCNLSNSSCSSLDNIQNIMDYAGSCRTMFTQGQSARMQNALNSGVAQRNNLWQTANLIATGTLGAPPLCEALVSSNVTTVCVGQSVSFLDESYHNVTGRTWTFAGGSPASSSALAPTVTYNTPGVYSVTLNVTDGSVNVSTTQTDYIIVLPDPGLTLPYFEGFEGVTAIPNTDSWMITNDNDDDAWKLSSTVGAGGSSKCAWLNNYGENDLSKDELISGSIDLSGVDVNDPIFFSFEYAYRKKSSNNDEWLRFYISKDCGETWVLRKNIHDDELSSVVSSASYTPSSALDWYYVEISNINSEYYVSNFRYKFQFENDNGNNIYIDNINLYPTSMSDIEVVSQAQTLSIYPNPANNQTTIEVAGSEGQEYTVSLMSALGQQMDVIYQGQLTDGLNKFNYSTVHLAKGIYFIRVESEGRLQTIKLIIE